MPRTAEAARRSPAKSCHVPSGGGARLSVADVHCPRCQGKVMPQLFAVIRRRTEAWDFALPMEQQPDWRPHADFMNALLAEGFLRLGGPLAGDREVLLILR